MAIEDILLLIYFEEDEIANPTPRKIVYRWVQSYRSIKLMAVLMSDRWEIYAASKVGRDETWTEYFNYQ